MTTITWGERRQAAAPSPGRPKMRPRPRPRAGLEIELVSADYLEVSAHGALTADRRQEVEDRLEDLVACGTEELRLSLADVPLIAPSVAAVLVKAADALRRSGRTLRLTEVPFCLENRVAELIEPGYRSALAGRRTATSTGPYHQ